MEDKKKEELEKMYALRAGLSVISQKCDKIDDIEEMERKNKSIVDIKKREIENEIDSNRQKEGKLLKPKKIWLILILLGIIIAIIINVLLIKNVEVDKNNFLDIIGAIIFYGGGLLAVLAGIGCLWWWISEWVHYKHAKKDVKDRNIVISISQRSCEQFQEQFQLLCSRNLPIKKSIIVENNVILNSLNKQFGNLLDIRDWENLDLVIYYYETGRADSIKEALQLVDNERRNNALIQAIGIATTEICRSIQSLGRVMIQGFASLSAQIEAQRVQITNAMSEMVTQQTLSNALLAKANVSSKEMVEQMKKLNIKIK